GRGVVVGVLGAVAWGAGQYAGHAFVQSCDEEDNVQAQARLVPPGASSLLLPGFEGTDEYTPRGADNGEVQQGLPPVRWMAEPGAEEGDDSTTPNPAWQPAAEVRSGAKITGLEWEPEEKRLTVIAPAAGYAVLRLMDYPAWVVRENGRVLAGRPHREDGLLTIPVPTGRTRVEVSYVTTPDVYAGRALSVVCLLVLALIAARERRRRVPVRAA
ncbi:MAG TPA: hypothetical protein VGD62_02250, partial [Acidobacteriaceae bacterium]